MGAGLVTVCLPTAVVGLTGKWEGGCHGQWSGVAWEAESGHHITDALLAGALPHPATRFRAE